jgi:hypothetical protein|tara:strand:- start:28 stop:360 length:333 start_codon:yes stop_codon:yes gene_type:complete
MSAFTDAIEYNWPDYVISPDTWASSIEEHGEDYQDEGSFSWQECDSCGSTLGGDRHEATAIHKKAFGSTPTMTNAIHEISICTDCLMFHANGDEPDDGHWVTEQVEDGLG